MPKHETRRTVHFIIQRNYDCRYWGKGKWLADEDDADKHPSHYAAKKVARLFCGPDAWNIQQVITSYPPLRRGHGE